LNERREGEALSKAAAIVLTEGEDFMSFKFRGLLTFAFAIVVANGALAAEAKRPNNLILFVADGLRALSVTADTAPAIAAVREDRRQFQESAFGFPDLHHRKRLGYGNGSSTWRYR
jgi:hypothetical protein